MLLKMSFQAGCLIGAALLLRLLARNYLPRATFLTLWAAAIARMLLPFEICWKGSAYSLLPRQTTPAGGTPAPWLITLWLCVALALMAVFAALFSGSLWVLRDAAACEEGEIIRRWRAANPMRRPLRIECSGKVMTPLSVGIFHPRIILPEGTPLEETELGYILTHEYCHLRHLDTLWKLLALAAACIHWFNPLAWAMIPVLNRDLELACDERTLRRLGGGREVRQNYAYTLLSAAQRKESYGIFRSGFAQTALEERIRSIMRRKKQSVFAAALAVILALSLCGAFLTGRQEPSSPARLVLPQEGLILKGELAELEKYSYAKTQEGRDRVLQKFLDDPDITVEEIPKVGGSP